MFKLKEIISIIIASLIIAFAITLVENPKIFAYVFSSVFLIILINTLAKKIVAFYLESEIEVKIWQLERWGLTGILLSGGYFHPSKKFKQAFPIGAFLPIFFRVIFIPFGSFIWMASLIFDVKTKIYKSAKRHNSIYSFSEITDYQIGVIASIGIIITLAFAIIGYLINLPIEMNFAKLSVFYALFNLLPLSNLDGNKIFFGNKIMWYALVSITLVGLGYALFLI
mgnify:CR=1 FL=1